MLSKHEYDALASKYAVFSDEAGYGQLAKGMCGEVQAMIMNYCALAFSHGIPAEVVHAMFVATVEFHILQRTGPDKDRMEKYIRSQHEMPDEAVIPAYSGDKYAEHYGELIGFFQDCLKAQLADHEDFGQFLDGLDLGAGNPDEEKH